MKKRIFLAVWAVVAFLAAGGLASAQCTVADGDIPAGASRLLGAVYSSDVAVSLGPWLPPAIPPATVAWGTSNSIQLTYNRATSPATLTTVIDPGTGVPTVVVYAWEAGVAGTLDFMQLKITAGGQNKADFTVETLDVCPSFAPFSLGSSSGPPAVFDKLVTGEDFTNGFTLTGTLVLGTAADSFSLQIAAGSLAPVNQPPDCSLAAPSAAKLWPPNHKFRNVNVVGVTDPDGDTVTITIHSIFQDEPVDGTGDGNTTPDGRGVGSSTAQVRAERDGGADGRVYHIGFTAADPGGASCTGEVLVAVPKSKGKNWWNNSVDGGALYDSTVP